MPPDHDATGAGSEVVVRVESGAADEQSKVDKKSRSASIAELYQFTNGVERLLLAIAVIAATTSGTAIPMIL